MEFLSEENIRLDDRMKFETVYNFSNLAKEYGWDIEDCVAKTTPMRNYFSLRGRNDLFFNKNNMCEIRKVKTGYFVGHYCFVEYSNNDVTIVIVGKNNILKISNLKIRNLKEAEQYLSKPKLLDIVKEKFCIFDVSKKVQQYQIFCEGLPNSCFSDSDFVKEVLKSMQDSQRINFLNVYDKKFINQQACNQEMKEYFVNLTKRKISKRKEDKEIDR